MTVISISIPKDINAGLTKLAKKQRLSKSQIVSEAIERYQLDADWAEIRHHGDRIAKRLGLETDDDVEKYFG